MLLAVCHSRDTGWTKVEDLTALSDLRAQEENVLWAETTIDSLDGSDVGTLAEEFGLHPLAVEDALHPRQRPKTESYDPHEFIVLHQLDEIDGQLEPSQLACFVGQGFVITIHDGSQRILEEAKRRWSEASDDDVEGAGFLVYTLLDVIIDDYQRIADRLEQEIEDLEELVLGTPGAPIQRQLYSLKQQVARLRRYALPAGRVVSYFLGEGKTLLTKTTLEQMRDVHDHVLRIGEQVRNIDDLSQAVLDLSRGAQADALNEVTKKLTGWAAIIAIPTLISSFYGMNFQLIPNENSIAGFFFALALMISAGIGLFTFFKWRGWI